MSKKRPLSSRAALNEPDAECAHCGRTITWAMAAAPYWFHQHSQSVYCWLGSDHPEERELRAEPKKEKA